MRVKDVLLGFAEKLLGGDVNNAHPGCNVREAVNAAEAKILYGCEDVSYVDHDDDPGESDELVEVEVVRNPTPEQVADAVNSLPEEERRRVVELLKQLQR